MSGSTENLLGSSSHLDESVESTDKHNGHTTNNERKIEHKEQNKGIVNPGFVGDFKNGDGLKNYSIDKRATSLKQGSFSSSFPARSRRHSSPDYDHNNNIIHRTRNGLSKHHRTKSASEDDLRKKAVLNSIKAGRKFQSVSQLPNYMENEKESQKQAENSRNNARQSVDKRFDGSEFKVGNLMTSERHQTPSNSLTTSPRQHKDDKDVLVALERAQLEQYKRRLTMALSERAKLTEQLKFLSAHVSQNLSRSSESELNSPRLASTPRLGNSPRISTVNTSSPRYPSPGGVDDFKELSLPPLPSKRKTRTIEKPDWEDTESPRLSEPTYSVRIIDEKSATLKFDEKDYAQGSSTKRLEPPESIEKNIGHSDHDSNETRAVSKKENLSKKVNDIWNEHLSGEKFSSGGRENVGKEETSDSTSTVNNKSNKPLTVEEFLSSDEKNDEKKLDYEQLDENDKEIRRVLDTAARHTPEIYEPLVYSTSTQQPMQDDKNTHLSRISSKNKEKTERHYEIDPDYQEMPTLKLRNNGQSRDAHHYESMPTDNSPSPKYTRLRRVDQTFSYMNPPGTSSTLQKNTRANLSNQGDSTSLERAPSDIAEKLRYYKGTLGNQSEKVASHDLADAYANEKDPEKRREIQQLAAAEAAVLRREASALLFEAMNLERICDPNARVRHIYLPQ